MGTNYYYQNDSENCPTCGHGPSPLHIGKSSMGWCFSLHVYPDEGITDLESWIDLFGKPGSVITNEYGEQISAPEMMQTILCRWRREPSEWSAGEYNENHAKPGPLNLIRHQLDSHCIGYGHGPYDYIVGDFS